MDNTYCMSKKTWPIWYDKILYEMGQDFLDIQYILAEYAVNYGDSNMLVCSAPGFFNYIVGIQLLICILFLSWLNGRKITCIKLIRIWSLFLWKYYQILNVKIVISYCPRSDIPSLFKLSWQIRKKSQNQLFLKGRKWRRLYSVFIISLSLNQRLSIYHIDNRWVHDTYM